MSFTGSRRGSYTYDRLDRLCQKFLGEPYPRHDKSRTIYHYLFRREALDELGNKCIKCGFSDWRALAIDHVKGGGSQRTETSLQMYSRIILRQTYANEFQLLCANCNQIKRYENGEGVTHLFGKKT
jgi:hypothetical protein